MEEESSPGAERWGRRRRKSKIQATQPDTDEHVEERRLQGKEYEHLNGAGLRGVSYLI